MTIESVLVAKDLSRDYQQGDLNLSVLKAVNLDIKRGEKLAIVGVSGSGKTTLLNLLGGLDDPSSGTVLVCVQHWGSLGRLIERVGATDMWALFINCITCSVSFLP